MSTLLLTRAEIAGLMTPADYLGAVETGRRDQVAHGELLGAIRSLGI